MTLQLIRWIVRICKVLTMSGSSLHIPLQVPTFTLYALTHATLLRATTCCPAALLKTSWNRFEQTMIVSSPGDYTGQQQKHEGPFHYLIKGKQRKEMEQSRSFQRSSWKFPAQPKRSNSAWLFRPLSYRFNYSNKL